MYNVLTTKTNTRDPNEQYSSEYVKVNVDEGIVAILSGVKKFKQLYFKTEPAIRNIVTQVSNNYFILEPAY